MYGTDQYFADLYYDDRSARIYCPDCAMYHHEEEMHERLDLCWSCGEKYEAAHFAERAADFQYLSKEWFQRDLMRMPLHELVDRDDAALHQAAE